MANDIAIPEWLKKRAGSASSSVDSMVTASISIPRISLKGKKFRVIEGGEEIQKPSDDLDIVILAVDPGPGLFTKTYYKDGYKSGDSSPPDCSSSDGIRPDAWISNPINDKCATCPMNAFGSATNPNTGKKTKACHDSKRIWCALAKNPGGTVYALNVTVSSMRALAEYGKLIKSHGVDLPAVITKAIMDDDSEFPKIYFEIGGFLDQEQGLAAIERSEERDWDLPMPSAPAIAHDKKDDVPTVEFKEKPKVEAKVEAKAEAPSGESDEDLLSDW